MSDAQGFQNRPEPLIIDVTPDTAGPTPGSEGYFDEGEPERPRRSLSRRRLVALNVAAVLGLAGAVALGGFGWRVATQQDPELETPGTLAGLIRDDSERSRGTVDYLRNGFAADIDLDTSIGAVYADPAASNRSVLLFGGTTLLWQPERDLDKLFELLSEGAGQITEIREVPAGALGGVMKCGRMAAEDAGELSVCGWADHGSVVMSMFQGRAVAESAALFRDIRAGVQHRG